MTLTELNFLVSRSDSKSIHPLLNQQKPHFPHEVLISKKNFHYFKKFHCIPYKVLFFKETKMQEKNHTHGKKLGNTSHLLINFEKLKKSQLYEVQFLKYKE